MRIGLIAVDGRGSFPNLALMRLSTWHKRQGDAVDWWNGFEQYDMGVEPFAQPYRDYNGGEPTEEQNAFARWVNRKSLFKSCTWEEYQK